MKFGGELRFEQFTILEPAAAARHNGLRRKLRDQRQSRRTWHRWRGLRYFPAGHSRWRKHHQCDPQRRLSPPDLCGLCSRRLQSYTASHAQPGPPVRTLHHHQRSQQQPGHLRFRHAIADRSQRTKSAIDAHPRHRARHSEQRFSAGSSIPTLNNFAPRIGLSYQIADKLVLRSGYGIFYGGQENGPFSNPSPGFNPPFLSSEAYNAGCTAPSANPTQMDCSISAANNGGLALNQLQAGFPNNINTGLSPLADPNAPELYSLDPHLVTPYTQQWHLGIEYQLPADTVFEVSYAGSRGLKLFAFYNGNQAVPVLGTDSLPTAPRRPANDDGSPAARSGPCIAGGRMQAQTAIPRSMSPSTPSARMRSRTTTHCKFVWRNATLTDSSTKRLTPSRTPSTTLPAPAWDR